jgi:acyl carrier protein
MNIEEIVKTVIAKQVGIKVENIELDSHVEDDLGADSLDIVEIVMELENQFEVVVDEEKVYTLTRVHQIIEFIERLKNNHT